MNIAIKLPDNIRDRVLVFPFLHALNKHLKQKMKDEENEDELINIHLISLKEGIDVLNLLPFEAYYHELDLIDIKNVFSMHRACVNLKLDKIDIFVSTTESFTDATIGKNIGAKTKIGYSISKNSLLLNKKVSLLGGEHKSVQSLEILKAFDLKNTGSNKVYSRSVDPLFPDWRENPYTVLNIDLINKKPNPEWIDFLSLYSGKTFILMCDQVDAITQKDILEDFIKELPKENQYKMFILESYIDFAKLISFCITFISNNSPLMQFSSYCGAHVFYLNKSEDMKIVGPEYFLGDVRNFSLKDPSFKSGSTFNYGKIFDEIFPYIDSRSKSEDNA